MTKGKWSLRYSRMTLVRASRIRDHTISQANLVSMGMLCFDYWPENHIHTTRVHSKSVSCMPNGYGQDGEIVLIMQKSTSLQ